MTGVELLFAILLIVLVAAAVAWAGLYIVMVQLRRRYVQEMVHISEELQTVANDLAQIDQAAGRFPADDSLPYGPLARDLLQRLQRTRESYESCSAQYAVLRQTEPQPALTLSQRVITILSHLRVQQRHFEAAQALDLQMATLQKQLAGAQQQAEQMRTLPLGVAGRVRSMLGASDRVTRLCQALQQAGVRGEGLDTLIATARTHGQAIETLPDYFRQGSNDTILKNATPEITREVWQKLGNIEKPIYDALRRAQQWQEVYNEAKNMVGAVQVEIAAAERILSELPLSIDARDHAAAFASLQGGAREIEAGWQFPDVHRLADLSNAATKQVMATQQLSGSIMVLQKTYQGFEQAVMSDAAMLDRIGATLDSVARTVVCPVVWDYSATEFRQLRAVQADIGDTHKLRAAGQLDTDLDRALDLGLQAGTLEARVNDVRDRHLQLQAWIASPEFQTRGGWFHEAASLYIEAMRYGPENWLERDGLSSLRPDASSLLGREQSLEPLFAHQAIPENAVQRWIDQSNAYLRERRAIQARLDSIAQTLSAVQSLEKSAQTQVGQVLETFGRLDQNVAQAMTTPAVVNAWNEVIDQWSDGKRLAEALAERQTGKIADKAADITTWAAECFRSLQALCQAVEAEGEIARQNLSDQVEALVAIAPFDAEPTMVSAQQLLDGEAVLPRAIGGRAARGVTKAGPKDCGELVEQINRTFERHSQRYEALDELNGRVVSQVEPRVTRLDEAHSAAWEKLQQLQALQRQIPPIKQLPIACDEADQLAEAFGHAESGLQDMAKTGRTVKMVVGRLDSLIQQFQYVANQGAGAQADIERDLVRLRSVWDQFSQWTRQLKRYREWQGSDRAAADAVSARQKEIDDQFLDIQRRYKGKSLPLEYACRELEGLLSTSRRDLEVPRDNGTEVIPAQTIQSV